MDADYRRFSEERTLQFNLAYAEGFEALTTAAARFAFETKQLERTHPSVRELFSWHLIEELEHRTVAFDVYDHIFGDYFYRLRWGLFAQRHMLSWIDRVARHMEKADWRYVREVRRRSRSARAAPHPGVARRARTATKSAGDLPALVHPGANRVHRRDAELRREVLPRRAWDVDLGESCCGQGLLRARRRGAESPWCRGTSRSRLAELCASASLREDCLLCFDSG